MTFLNFEGESLLPAHIAGNNAKTNSILELNKALALFLYNSRNQIDNLHG